MTSQTLSLSRADNSNMRTDLYLPDFSPVSIPGVIVIFDVFGITPDLSRIAARFTAEGYAVIIPDIFDRSGPKIFCVVSAIRSAMRGSGREFDDIELARKALCARPEIDSSRIGICGFCLGGAFAILLAKSGVYKVSAPFYGEVPRKIDALRGSCPLVAGYGLNDSASMVESGKRLESFLQELQVPHDVKFYPGAGHGFMNRNTGFLAEKVMPHMPVHAGYNQEASEDSFRRIFAFFKTHLAASESA